MKVIYWYKDTKYVDYSVLSDGVGTIDFYEEIAHKVGVGSQLTLYFRDPREVQNLINHLVKLYKRMYDFDKKREIKYEKTRTQ